MILEGFTIENWSCIKRICVEELPARGLIVLHGPNGTGKSSAIEALRACLMDYKSTSRALVRGFPKNSSEKPRVIVRFRAGGVSYRITKQFGTKNSTLESRTGAGAWKLETADPTEAHDRTRSLTGGTDSDLGLHQLLWLTQAEFKLPSGELDANVQTRLRGVLGVLQTELDDRFLKRVTGEWKSWFNARGKPGNNPKLRDCSLVRAREELQALRIQQTAVENEFRNVEGLTIRADGLQAVIGDLRSQVEEQTRKRDHLQAEYEASLKRLEAHRLAEAQAVSAQKACEESRRLAQRRSDLESKVAEAERAAACARQEAEERSAGLEAALTKLRRLRYDLQAAHEEGRGLQSQAESLRQHRGRLDLQEQWRSAAKALERAEQLAGELDCLKREGHEPPAPNQAMLASLEANRASAAKLRAELEAAAITLILTPDAGSRPATLTIDGSPASAVGAPIELPVRRRAQISIPGWGRAELIRGADARGLDQIDAGLHALDQQFAEQIALYGIAQGDPTALDRLRALAAEERAREPEIRHKQDELEQHAPEGLEALRESVGLLQQQVWANEAAQNGALTGTGLFDRVELDHRIETLNEDLRINAKRIAGLEGDIRGLEQEIEEEPANAHENAIGAVSLVAGRRGHAKAGKSQNGSGAGKVVEPAVRAGLRSLEADGRDRLIALGSTAAHLRDELNRLPTAEQIERTWRDAEIGVEQARNNLDAATLTLSETTIRARLDAAIESLRSLEVERTASEKELHQIEGAIGQSEGLHPRRTALAARIEALERRIERETLEAEAIDRLCALFEECREKQLGELMTPVQDRVLGWMQSLAIGGYESIRWSDQFLPEQLIAGGGAVELALKEESVGTMEQIGIMVRLALGSMLSTPEEPVAAVLDDPLTHSDVIRLDRMRAILKSATLGDATMSPPAGPMQILVFTCHPEWFQVDGASMIELSKQSDQR